MPHEGDNTWAERYGMDSSGDGVMDADELNAYYAYKAKAEEDLKAEQAKAAQARAVIAAQNASDFETVPGFVDRRRSHMSDLNDHNYAEPLSPNKAVFPFVEMGHGPMAGLLERPTASPPGADSMAPRGRSRAGEGFFEAPRQ